MEFKLFYVLQTRNMTFRDNHTELASRSVRGPLKVLNMREKILSMVSANIRTSTIFASASVG